MTIFYSDEIEKQPYIFNNAFIETNDTSLETGKLDHCESTVTYEESSKAIEENEEHLREELQYEEVDMTNPKMDPLEWAVRKIVPIPKRYFWDVDSAKRHDNAHNNGDDLALKTKAWHVTVYTLGRLVTVAETIGGNIASWTGLNQSRFDDVLSCMTEEEWEEARRIDTEKRLKREQRKRKDELLMEEKEALEMIGASQGAL